MNYQETIDNFRKIKAGMSRDEIIKIMGQPEIKKADSWHYDFSHLENVPSMTVGSQIFRGGTIFFSPTGSVNNTKFSWIDVTGPESIK